MLTGFATPGLSGRQVIERLRAIEPSIPIVIVTGHATQSDIDRANLGGIPVLGKPISLEQLSDVLLAVRKRTER